MVLLGTGARQQFLPMDLMMEFYGRGVGAEVMSTAAACRTFNVLVSESPKKFAGDVGALRGVVDDHLSGRRDRARERGVSKYGVWNRLWVGIVDLFGVGWLQRRERRPRTVTEHDFGAR